MITQSNDPIRLLDEALASTDEAWPEAEAALLAARDRGVPLETAVTHRDPVARAMATAATDIDASGRGALERATAYLDGAARYFARTAARMPPIGGVLDNLTATFGPALAQPFALRLAQRSDMPNWRVVTTLAYLDRHPDPAVVPSLVRFAVRTNVESQQELAIRILEGIGGPAVAASIREEQARIAAAGGRLPPALASLAGTAA